MQELKKIDHLIDLIKEKIDSTGVTSADMFIIMTLEILRGEISSTGITELTIKACWEISANISHYYYYRDYHDLYCFLQNVFIEIRKLDSRFYDADLDILGSKIEDRVQYISKAGESLLNSLPTLYCYKDKKGE